MSHITILGPRPRLYDWEAEKAFETEYPGTTEAASIIDLDIERRQRRMEPTRVNSALTVIRHLGTAALNNEVQ